MNEASKYSAPAVDKCLDILEFLAEQPSPLNQAEIATALNKSPNQIYRILFSLEQRGYLIREGRSGRYRVSLKLYNLTRSISPIDQLRQCAMPHMEDFAVETGMSCHLCMLYQSQTMVIVHSRSPSPISLNVAEGALFSTVATASGNILLANSKEEVKQMLLARSADYRSMSSFQKSIFTEKLKNIREHKLSQKKDALASGVNNIATLIGEPNGKIIASLAVSSVKSKPQEDTQQVFSELRLIVRLKEVANLITDQLGLRTVPT